MLTFGPINGHPDDEQPQAVTVRLLARVGGLLNFGSYCYQPELWGFVVPTRTREAISLLLQADGPFVVSVACFDVNHEAGWDCRALLSVLHQANASSADGPYRLVKTRTGHTLLSVVEIEVRPFGEAAFTVALRRVLDDFEALLARLRAQRLVPSPLFPTRH